MQQAFNKEQCWCLIIQSYKIHNKKNEVDEKFSLFSSFSVVY